jgi:polyhydroxyalkanoate synthesis regulator phasin
LKDKEKRLMDELEQLNQTKKHQKDVNNRIKEIEELLKDDEGNNEKEIQSKQKELDELNQEIKHIDNQIKEKQSRFNSDKVTDLEKIDLKKDIE